MKIGMDYITEDLRQSLSTLRERRKLRLPRSKPKIANLIDLHKANYPYKRPTERTRHYVFKMALRMRKVGIGPDGRFYTVHPRNPATGMEIGTPRGMRWQNGKLIPRRAS